MKKQPETIYQLKDAILTRLYSASEIDSAIMDVLEMTGNYFHVSRVYIFENSEDDTSCSNTYEWCSEGIPPEKEKLQNVRYLEALGGKWMENYDENGLFFCADVQKLPDKQRDILLPQGIYTMLQSAILDNGVFKGFIGFDNCSRADQNWGSDTEAVDALLYISKLLTMFLMEQRNKMHLAKSKRDLERAYADIYANCSAHSEEAVLYQSIVKDSSTAVVIIEKKERKVMFANQAWRDMEGIGEKQEIIGHYIFELLPQEHQLFSEEEIHQMPYDSCRIFHRVRENGVHLQISARSLRWNGVSCYTCYIIDETEIQHSRERLAGLIDQVPGGIVICEIIHSQLSLKYANEGYLRMLDETRDSREKYKEDKMLEAIYPKDHVVIHQMVEEFERGAKSQDIIYRLKTGKGNYLWIRLVAAVTEKHGETIVIYGSVTDVDELIRTQKEREMKYREQLRQRKMVIQRALTTRYFNLTQNKVTEEETKKPEFARILKNNTLDYVLQEVQENYIFDEEDREKAQYFTCVKLMKAFRQGNAHVSIRHRLKLYPGWFETCFDMVENPYTNEIEGISTLTDITEEVRAEKIIGTLSDIDYDYIFALDVNRGMVVPYMRDKLYMHMPNQPLAGRDVEMLQDYLLENCADEDVKKIRRENSMDYVKKVLKTIPVYTTRYSVKEKGKIAHKRCIYTYLKGEESIILCAIQDWTDAYEIEEKQKLELSQALYDVKEANNAKTEFFSRMSHDMRTPMNGILGLAALSEDETDIEVLRENMGKIKTAGEYLLGLINDTLDFQKIESGKMKIVPQVVECRGFLENMLEMVKISAKEKKIAFQVDMDLKEVEGYVRIDPIRMKQVFLNLLSNAIKFTPEQGAVLFQIKCEESDHKTKHAVIRVKDTGIGMSEDFLRNKIFRSFSQEYNKMSALYAGSGLGLSIVKKLVDMMGGTIEVESSPGYGTTFTLAMEVETVDASELSEYESEGASKQESVRESLKGKRILLVEDHALNAEIAKRLLQKAGCEITWVKNGRLGVEKFMESEEGTYDAVLMDIRMPVMDGLTAARWIRNLARKDADTIPILAMTANAYDEDVKKSKDAGMNDHLSKPIEPQRLYGALSKYIGRDQKISEHSKADPDKAYYFTTQGASYRSGFDGAVKKDEVEMNMATLKKMVQTVWNEEGAFEVPYRSFNSIYQFLERNLSRTKQDIQILLFTIVDGIGNIPPDFLVKPSMEALTQAVQFTLRKGDLMMEFNVNQVAVLLMNCDILNGTRVANRILRAYHIKMKDGKLVIQYEASSIQERME